MVPPLPDTPRDDTEFDGEFDLDVRLHAVARHISDERGEKPGPQGTITECTCPATKCECE
jgi:hypothetical protein